MPACGWVSAEWREGRRLPRPVLWREQFPIPDRGLVLYPPNMGKQLRRSLPHPHSQSPLVHRHLAQVSNISRLQPRCPKTVTLMLFCGFDRFLALLPLEIKFSFLVWTTLRWIWCMFDVILFTPPVSPRGRDLYEVAGLRVRTSNCTPIWITYWMAVSLCRQQSEEESFSVLCS